MVLKHVCAVGTCSGDWSALNTTLMRAESLLLLELLELDVVSMSAAASQVYNTTAVTAIVSK